MVLGKTLFIALTLVAIGAQVPHAYHAFTENSKLRSKNLRIIQGMLFCGILSVAIFAFVLIEKPMLALLGALIESLINVYYYTMEFWEEGFKRFQGDDRSQKRRRSILTFWRKNWFKIFLSLLIPMFIYIFSEILVNNF